MQNKLIKAVGRAAGIFAVVAIAFTGGVCAPDFSRVHNLPSLQLAFMLMQGRIQSALLTAAHGDTGLYSPFDAYTDVLGTIQSEYYGKPHSTTQLTYDAIRGMMGSLNDRYTRFVDPTAYNAMKQDQSGDIVGIGAMLGTNKLNEVFVVRTIKGGPAERAKVLAGDIIATVDGKSTLKMSDSDVVKLIRGEPNTKVTLSLIRKGAVKPVVLTIPRGLVHTEVVQYAMIDPAHKIGYLLLSEFNEESDHQLHSALDDLKSRGMKGLILDLRENPGGLLDMAQRIASRFIPSGPVVFTRDKNGDRETRAVISGLYDKRHPFQLVVLVNGDSASCSEILSGAIKDTRTGILVGERTFGKGLVQEVDDLPDGSAAIITIEHYFTPNGHDINHKGIIPNIVVKYTDSDERHMFDYLRDHPDSTYDLKYDTQLQHALTSVKQKVTLASRLRS